MNPYNELGLTNIATPEEIKQKYRILAQQFHPDKGGEEEKFKTINLAYEILIDPERRAHYDATGKFHADADIRGEAIMHLSNLLLNILPRINIDTDDLIFMMKIEINRMTAEIHADAGNRGRSNANLERMLNKLKLKKNDKENILRGFLEKHLRVNTDETKGLERRLKICALMEEILDDYHWGDADWMLHIMNGEIPDAPVEPTPDVPPPDAPPDAPLPGIGIL